MTTSVTRFQQMIAKNTDTSKSRRKFVNALMLLLSGLMTLIAVIPLFWIVGYVIYKGGQYINFDFFTQLPRPLGITGGGVLNAIEGTLVITLLASVFSMPIGILAAFYAARSPNTPLGIASASRATIANGPEIPAHRGQDAPQLRQPIVSAAHHRHTTGEYPRTHDRERGNQNP